ncbi:MAG TPA: hypothetical protein PK857_00275 [Hyphomicrobium sp.]|nr:hypothetical protein [Hyphomicrobium sp.]
MNFQIVRRQFAKVDDAWFELEDLQQRGISADRSWSSFCVFVPAENPDAKALTLKELASPPHIDIIPSVTAGGVWVMGPHYKLESVVPRLRCGSESN